VLESLESSLPLVTGVTLVTLSYLWTYA
jgi:hypothetical protein